jgi:septum formation protein
MTKLILASGSPFRRAMLENAGVTFEVARPAIDERAVEAPLTGSGASAEDIALVLAEAKALDVSETHPDAIVIGSDQTLSLDDRIFQKPADMEGARRHLLAMSAKTHHLNSAVVIAQRGEAVWRHVSVASLTMRELSPAFIGRYMAQVGDKALQSVGAYQIEGQGIQLFDRIEGDHFTIVGLPLLPLLKQLRDMGAIDG